MRQSGHLADDAAIHRPRISTVKQTAATRLCIRRAIATAKAAREQVDPMIYAAERWRGDSPVVTRAAVGGSEAADWSVAADYDYLFDAVLEQSVLGRANLVRVPFNVRLLGPGDEIAANWTEPGKAIRVSRVTLTGSALEQRKVAAISIVSNESLEARLARVETALERSFRSAMALALDAAFLDPANGGSAAKPASITAGAPTIASSGDIRTDLAELVEHFSGDLTQSVLIMHPATATQLALVTDSSGSLVFSDLGPNGGTLVNMPVLCSRAVPWDTSGGSITLLDGSGIALAAEGLDVFATDEALVEMDDAAPTGASDTPVAASETPVLLYQVGATAFRFTMRANWERKRAGCVSVISGASY